LLAFATPAAANRNLKNAYRLLDEGRAKEALALFRAIADARPRTLSAHEGMAWSLLKLGQPELAAKSADARLRLSDDPTWRRKWLDIVAQVPARRLEAILGFRRVAREHPDDIDARLRLGQLLLEDNRAADALPEIEAAVSARPKDPAARESLVWALVRLRRVADEMREADARRAMPGGESWRLKWADVAAQVIERRKEAAQIFADEVQKSPDDLVLRQRLGHLLLEIGDAASAKPHLEKVAAANQVGPRPRCVTRSRASRRDRQEPRLARPLARDAGRGAGPSRVRDRGIREARRRIAGARRSAFAARAIARRSKTTRQGHRPLPRRAQK
jgi:tetratricopeptide (TPR) repeat protein